jgi:DNA-binding transcriptional LysR family regulator
MTIAVAHAVGTGIGLAALPHIVLEDPMFKDVLRPVLVTHPLRDPHLYAVYVSRRRLPLKICTFIDHIVEHTQIPRQ